MHCMFDQKYEKLIKFKPTKNATTCQPDIMKCTESYDKTKLILF